LVASRLTGLVNGAPVAGVPFFCCCVPPAKNALLFFFGKEDFAGNRGNYYEIAVLGISGKAAADASLEGAC